MILKWKKVGTIRTLPRPGHLAKLSNQGEWLMYERDKVSEEQPSLQPTIDPSFGKVARRKPLLSPKKHLKDTQIVRNKILW